MLTLSTNQRGELAQLKVQERAISLGYTLSIPTIDCRYDLVIDNNGKFTRVQIKHVTDNKKNNSVRLKLEKKEGKKKVGYTKDEIDLILVYVDSIDKILQIKPAQFHNKKKLSIKVRGTNRNLKTENWYEDFLW